MGDKDMTDKTLEITVPVEDIDNHFFLHNYTRTGKYKNIEFELIYIIPNYTPIVKFEDNGKKYQYLVNTDDIVKAVIEEHIENRR